MRSSSRWPGRSKSCMEVSRFTRYRLPIHLRMTARWSLPMPEAPEDLDMRLLSDDSDDHSELDDDDDEDWEPCSSLSARVDSEAVDDSSDDSDDESFMRSAI